MSRAQSPRSLLGIGGFDDPSAASRFKQSCGRTQHLRTVSVLTMDAYHVNVTSHLHTSLQRQRCMCHSIWRRSSNSQLSNIRVPWPEHINWTGQV